MTSYKDLLFRLLLLMGAYFLTSYLTDNNFLSANTPWTLPVFFIPFVLYLVIRKRLRGKIVTSDALEHEFNSLNYQVLLERPLTLKEQYENFEFEFGLFINGISLGRLQYKARMQRYFKVRNEKDHDFELIVTITQTWRDKIKYRIESTSRIRN